MESATTQPEKLWEPSPEAIRSSAMTRFMEWLASERGLDFGSYAELWEWSSTEIEAFWAAIWDYFSVGPEPAGAEVLSSHGMPGAKWFEGAELNYAEHLFRDRPDGEVAIASASELRELSETTWGELREQVAAAAAGLRSLGVGRGDRVVAYLPNIPEAIVGFLATASIGAIWSSC
ncbi:MAG: AMP-binding protein, partial [Solirubrobacterales bacterium]